MVALAFVPVVGVSVAIGVELVEPAVLPELVVLDAPVLPALVAAALPAVEPCAAAPVAPPGVPVVPMGVFCVLRWPAPTAGSVAGAGGVAWAKARLKVAAVTAAARILGVFIVQGSLKDMDLVTGRFAGPHKIRSPR